MKTLCGALLFALSLLPLGAAAEDRSRPTYVETEEFATLPAGVRFPEGIASNPATGDIYVGTFDFGPNPNNLVRFSANGKVEAMRDFGGTPLLGLGFARGHVYVLNFGASKLQRLPADFGPATPIQDVASFPSIGPPAPRPSGNPDGTNDLITFASAGFPAPNAMVFDGAGNLYVSDSFQGAIYRIANATTCAAPCPVQVVSHDSLLATAGFPPFGANGLALSEDAATLFIANTGDNRVLKMNVSGTPTVSVFAESVHGADGLWLEGGRLWVAANQSDVVVALDANGRQTIRAGEFEGIRDGTPRGLLFPASLTAVRGWMYVANLALPLTPMVGDEPEEDVRVWTVSRFKLKN